jgi:hypothetical protein
MRRHPISSAGYTFFLALARAPLRPKSHAHLNVLEGVITQNIPGDPAMIGRQLARWNLQAVGLPVDQVEQALALLDG